MKTKLESLFDAIDSVPDEFQVIRGLMKDVLRRGELRELTLIASSANLVAHVLTSDEAVLGPFRKIVTLAR